MVAGDQIIDVPGMGPVAFPAGMSDADIVAAIKSNAPQGPATSKPAEPSLGDRAARVAGLGGRAVIQGLTAIPTLMAEAVAAPLRAATGGRYFQSPSDVLQRTMTQAGLPEPATPIERFSTDVTGAMAGMGGQLGAVRSMAPTSQFGQGMQQTLLQQPGRQVAAAGTGSAAASITGQMGGGPLAQTAAGMAGSMLPFVPQMIRGPQTPEALRTAETTQRGMDAGYRLPPSQTNPGLINSALEGGIAGKAPTERLASIKNQEVTNRLAKEALGFPQNKALTETNLREYRDIQALPYREISAISQQASKALDELKDARFNASANHKFYARSGDPEALAKARGFDQVVENLESMFESLAKSVGRPELIDRLRQARTNIAKSYSVERALNEATGNVDARLIASQFDKGAPLTGPLQTIGRTANVYGPSMRLPENVGPAPSFSMFDYLTALGAVGGAAGTQNPAFLAGAALPVARPAVRGMLLSSPYQSLMASPDMANLTRQQAMSLGLLPSLYAP